MIRVPADLIGREVDVGTVTVTPAMIAAYAVAVGDTATVAAGSIEAPPTFCLVLHRGMRPEVQLPDDMFGVYGGHDLEFFHAIRAGATYHLRACVAEVYEKFGRSGALTVVVREATIRDANDVVAVRIRDRQIVRKKPAAAGGDPGEAESSPRNSRAAQAEEAPPEQPIFSGVSKGAQGPSPSPRANPIVELGAELGPRHRPGTLVEQVAQYIDVNEISERFFVDRAHARGLGYRGTVVPGPMLTAFLEHFLRAELPDWHVERLGTTFRIPTISGDPLTIRGVITEHHEMADAERIVCDLVVEHDDGERAVTGAATLRTEDGDRRSGVGGR